MKTSFGLYLILTDPMAGYIACAEAAVKHNIRYLQLRMKNTPDTQFIETARVLKKITQQSNTKLIINDHLHIAIEADADGIHLGQEDLSLETARNTWKTPGKIFGLSTHNPEQERQARLLHPDYIGVGPVFSTPTKSDTAPPLGIQQTGKICQTSPITTVAIGGINQENLPNILENGVTNFCVVRAVNQHPNPEVAIDALQKIWKNTCF